MFGLIPVSRWQFGLFRVAFGLYLIWHFLGLMPYAGELFSREGTVSDPELSPLFGILPSPLWIQDSPAMATAIVAAAAFASALLAVGWNRRIAAVIVLYLHACLFCRNPLIANPSLAYVGLMLLLRLMVPAHEACRIRGADARKWYFPSGVYWTAWLLLAAGYTFSGLIKLQSPSWVDGSALLHLAGNPLARPGVLRDALLALPMEAIRVMTWIALLGEILFLPLSLFRRARLIMWSWMLAMHLGILMVVDFFDLTAAMVLIHGFTFDPRWFPARVGQGSRTLFFDGACGLCTHSVRFLMQEDHAGLLRFAPLQGETAAQRLPADLRDPSDLSTVVLLREGTDQRPEILTRSAAIIAALDDIGGFWRIPALIARRAPRRLRDSLYDFIARHRLRFFPGGTCSLPTPEEHARLLR